MTPRPPEPGAGAFTDALADARVGSSTALGELLDGCRRYLLAVANQNLDPALRPKAAASDLVQETLHNAHVDFQSFAGTTEDELIAWLVGILKHRLHNLRRDFATGKRRLSRERPASHNGASGVAAPQPSPSSHAAANEHERLHAELLEKLAAFRDRLPADEREVVELFLQLGNFRAVAARLGCVEKTARRRFARAVLLLRQSLGDSPP